MPDPFLIPGAEPSALQAPRVEVGVTQRADDLTGIPKIDAGIKITKYLGFPIVVAGALMYMFYQDKQASQKFIERSAASTEKTAEAVAKGVDIQATTSKALWTLQEGQEQSQEVLKDSQEVLKGILEQQKKAAEILESSDVHKLRGKTP